MIWCAQTYVSRVDKDKCVGCGECVQICPVNALKLGQKLCAKTPIVERRELTLPIIQSGVQINGMLIIVSTRKMLLIQVQVLVKHNVQHIFPFKAMLS